MKRIAKGFKYMLTAIVAVAVVALSVLTITGYLGQFDHYLEVTSHFRFVYLLAFLPCLIFLATFRYKKSLVVASLFFLINAAPIAQLYMPHQNQARSSNERTFTVLQINTWGIKNPRHDLVLQHIRTCQPDIVGVTELTPTWDKKLKEGLSDYPYRIVERRFGGVALYSKFLLRDAEVLYTGDIRRPRIRAKVVLPEQVVSVIFAHPVTPKQQYRLRDLELTKLACDARAAGGPVIVFGDMNCSPWSYHFAKLMKDGDLRDTERGFGLQPSWPAIAPLTWVTIDHCLTSDDFVALDRKTGPYVGSDHLPVLVKLALETP